MNSVQMIGRLTKDLDLRYTSTGKAVATGTLAVNRRFKNAQGESEADFINIQIWDKSAENLANFTRKGSQIGINGRIQTRNYENKEGARVYVTEIVVENFTLLEKKSDNAPQQSRQGNEPLRHNDYLEGGKYAKQAPDPFASHGESIQISESDLPF